MTLARANWKRTWSERIRGIFVTPLVFVWVGSFPRKNLHLVCYLTFRGVGVVDHVLRVATKICMTQVVSLEEGGTLNRSGSGRWCWNWSCASRGLKSADDVVGAHCAALKELRLR